MLLSEPMNRHTSFQIGGPADLLIRPKDLDELSMVFVLLSQERIPYFILGAGANILVSDKGIRGAVIDMSELKGFALDNDGERHTLSAMAGTTVNEVCREALRLSLSGLEFLYSMPGSIGGSIWMNARCYGSSISEVLNWVEVLGEKGALRRIKPDSRSFGYKRSPFQGKKVLIYRGAFHLQPGESKDIGQKMIRFEQDRERKGHFLFPCAGSIFKNNRAFGDPTGKIIDSLGLKGYSIGAARISELQANIIVNTGNAKAAEVLELIKFIEEKVNSKLGFVLEREVLMVGEW
ncbi:UDP-N-acetylenolpyruvoylglucosamine reductase [subsurface metagenome]